MDKALEASHSLWSDDQERHVISILRRGKIGQTLQRNDYYHILKTYDLVSVAGIDQAIKKSSGKRMITKSRALHAIQLLHRETGHGEEVKTYNRVREQYDNISRNLVSEFIKQCESNICKKRNKIKYSQ